MEDMTNTVFLHVRLRELNDDGEIIVHAKAGETIAMEPIQGWVVDTLNQGDFFEKKIGTAKCSDEDNFNKKIGRDLAQSRMKSKKLTVISNDNYTKVRILVLEDTDGDRYFLYRYKNANLAYLMDFWRLKK